MAIISIVAAMAIPRFDMNTFRIETGVRTVQVALHQAQRYAVQRQHDVIVGFDVAGGEIRILFDLDNDAVADSSERVSYRYLEEGVRFATPPSMITGGDPAVIRGSQISTVAGLPSVIFRRNGAASTDLQVYITTARGKNTDFRGLAVIQSTGRVDWYRFLATGGWQRGPY